MSMNNEESLENLFQSGVALLERGSSPQRVLEVLGLDEDAGAHLAPLLEIVDTTLDLPRYRMPATAKAALLSRLTAQNNVGGGVVVPLPLNVSSSPDHLLKVEATRPNRRQRWN